MKRSGRFILLATGILFALGIARADIVYTHDGQKYEGDVEDAGDTIIIKMKYGMKRKIPKTDVARIVKKKSATEEYDEKLTALKIIQRSEIAKAMAVSTAADATTAASVKTLADVKKDLAEKHYRLGLWCKKKGLGKEKKERFQSAIELNAEHAGAHTALGHVKYLGRWVPEAEKMKAEGFVLYKHKWRKPEEVEKLKATQSKTMLERMREVNKTDPKNSMNRKCTKCSGSGIRERVDCAQCNGNGELKLMSGLAICHKCGGSGKKVLYCPWCGGKGKITKWR